MARTPRLPTGLLASLVLLASSCSAVYPEVATPLKAPRAGSALVPPPPEDLYFVRFKGATIPEQTRDGRKWDAVGGAAPDPFAKVVLGDKELFRTPIQPNTVQPSWPDAKAANYRIPKGASVTVELWDSNPINNHPICVKVIRDFHEDARAGAIEIQCESGARISLITEPAHGRIGLGFWYELRTQSIHVTRVAAESPAARVGLKAGDQIARVQSQDVSKLDEAEARSLINSNAGTGLTLTIQRNGTGLDLSLKEGPVYPTAEDDITLE